MKHKAKIKRRSRRIKDFEATVSRLGADKAKGYKRPGSLKR